MAPKTKYFNKFFDDELPVSVAGKVFVITGTTSGSGFIATKTVLQKGGTVVALNRKSQRVTDATAKLKQELSDDNEVNIHQQLVNVECDLQKFSSVRSAIAEIKSKYSKLYCLANNAGIGSDQDNDSTVDGFNKQAQTNQLSHFLLAAELFPLLAAQGSVYDDDAARVVNMTSGIKDMAGKTGLLEKYFAKQPAEGGQLGGPSGQMTRYAQTKLSNVVFMHALDQRLKAAGNTNVRAICADPGAMGKDDMSDDLKFFLFRWLFYCFIHLKGNSREDGTMGLLLGMMSPKAVSGVLYGPANGGLSGPAVANEPKPYENDAEAIDMLWRASEEATGVKFVI